MRNFRRVMVCSDTHSGHHYGLTPPEWWFGKDSGDRLQRDIGEYQRDLWGFAADAIDRLKPIDILLMTGDAIDGKGEKSGGVEQLTTDRVEQCRMLARFIDETEAEKVRMVYGTRYHVGKEDDFESIIPDFSRCKDIKIEGHGFYNVNGCVIDAKHKIGASQIPHGRHTAISRARMWNVMWHTEKAKHPLSNIILRGHVHYFNYAGGPSWVGVTLPALCYHTIFGVRECEGLVDLGIVWFDIYDSGRFSWDWRMAEFPGLDVEATIL